LDNGLFIAFALELILFAVAAPELFIRSRTMEAILRLSGPAGIVLASYTITLISGQIDLSTAQVGGMASLMFAAVFQLLEWPLGVALALTVVLTVAVGLLSSYLIQQGIPSFVSTLAVGVVCGGIGFLIIDLTDQPGMIRLVRPPLRDIANFELLGVPFVIPMMFVAYAIGWVVLNQTNPDPSLGEDRSEYLDGRNPHPFLSSHPIRQAMSMAIDRTRIAALYGFAGRPECDLVAGPPRYRSGANDVCLAQDIDGAK